MVNLDLRMSALKRITFIYLLVGGLASSAVQAQKLTLDVYRVLVVTNTGKHYRGLLDDISDTELYLSSLSGHRIGEQVSLNQIRKVVVRRNSKKSAIITGAVIGGLAAGFASYQSLQLNRPSSNINYGITLTFAAAGGAAAGLLVGALFGNFSGRVIRPLGTANPELSLYRQLEPFTIRYQQDFFNRIPQTR